MEYEFNKTLETQIKKYLQAYLPLRTRLIGYNLKKNVESQILEYEFNKTLETQKKNCPQKNPCGIFFTPFNTNAYGKTIEKRLKSPIFHPINIDISKSIRKKKLEFVLYECVCFFLYFPINFFDDI